MPVNIARKDVFTTAHSFSSGVYERIDEAARPGDLLVVYTHKDVFPHAVGVSTRLYLAGDRNVGLSAIGPDYNFMSLVNAVDYRDGDVILLSPARNDAQTVAIQKYARKLRDRGIEKVVYVNVVDKAVNDIELASVEESGFWSSIFVNGRKETTI